MHTVISIFVHSEIGVANAQALKKLPLRYVWAGP